jgi:hypothetical protein
MFKVKTVKKTKKSSKQMIPMRYAPPSGFNSATHSINSFVGKGHSGVKVTGSIYLGDLNPTQSTIPGGSAAALCRTILIEYLNPSMISSKIAKLARAFKHYKFTRVKLEFVSEVPTTVAGEILLGVAQDISDDPSILLDRKLRAWYDGLEQSANVKVYGAPTAGECSTPWIVLRQEKNWYEISFNTTSPEESHQAKIFVGGSNMLAGFYGQLKFHYELLLVDQDETIFDINAEMIGGNVNNFNPTIAAFTTGNPITWTTAPVPAYPSPGIYSIFNPTDQAGTFAWNKIVSAGAEFICTIVGVPGLATMLYTVYDTIADWTAGNPTLSIGGSSSFRPTMFANPLCLDSNSLGMPPGRSGGLRTNPAWQRELRRFCDVVPGYSIRKGQLVETRLSEVDSSPLEECPEVFATLRNGDDYIEKIFSVKEDREDHCKIPEKPSRLEISPDLSLGSVQRPRQHVIYNPITQSYEYYPTTL